MAKHTDDCGIYKWTNLVTGRVLVGQAGSTTGFSHRKSQYLYALRKGIFTNHHFQASWTKHGEQNFSFEILEKMPIGKKTFIDYADELTLHEQSWVDYYRKQPEGVYNQVGPVNAPNRGRTFDAEFRAKVATGMKGKPSPKKGVPLPQETKDKISKKLKGVKIGPRPRSVEAQAKSTAAIRAALLGKPLSDEHKQKISEKNKGKPWSEKRREAENKKQAANPKPIKRKLTHEELGAINRGRVVSAEVRAKISKTTKGVKKGPRKTQMSEEEKKARSIRARKVPVDRIDAITGECVEYESVSDAEKDGFDSPSIFHCLSGAAKKHRKFFWIRRDSP